MYSLNYKVTTSTCDSEGKLKLFSALQMMQDLSLIHILSVNGIPITDYCTYLNLKFDTDERHYVYRSAQGEIKEIAW